MKPESRKLAVISTAHMTPVDNKILDSISKREGHGGFSPLSGLCGATFTGYWFYNCIDDDEWKKEGLSEDLKLNLQKVFAMGFDRVELDRDAAIVKGLTTFKW